MDQLDDIVKEFLLESHEGLDQLDRDLVALEQAPEDRALLAAIFRCIHTIKGTCGFLGFGRLERVAHAGESLLALLRDGRMLLTPDATSLLLQLVDAVRAMLAAIEATGSDGEDDYPTLTQALLDAVERHGRRMEDAPSRQAHAVAANAAPAPVPAPARTAPAATAPAQAPDTLADAGRSGVSDTNIRVDVDVLDRLMNLVGELVLARNQILQHAGASQEATFLAATQRLNLITTELQEGVMKTRMQPIGNVWNKFPRVVRDLALLCGKQVAIEMEGKDTELDKTIIEAIKDPLTHIVRNAVDHGIEPPAERAARGKPAEGRLALRAFHEGGQVNIEIADDGGGIDPERVKRKAVDRGLITAEAAARLGEREALNLIFLPGLSTAAQITNVSGRGVGMDVVRTNIEKIGGMVDVQSTPGAGTTLRIKIPLTLAIIPALTVTAAGERFAIPQVNLLELVRLDAGLRACGIERIKGVPVYRLRGNLLPLVYLDRELGLAAAGEGTAAHGRAATIVVLRADKRVFGLVVDDVNDTTEIVVKPLGTQLKGIPVLAGATIMGDGRVALILDVMGLAQRAGVAGEGRERIAGGAGPAGEAGGELRTLLVLRVGESHRVAIPLDLVARLEEIPRGGVERAGDHEVVQYRGEILPLVRLAGILGVPEAPAEGETLPVVVYAAQGRPVGIVVDAVQDIIEERLTVSRPVARDGLLGSAVIAGRVTDLLDVEQVVRLAHPGPVPHDRAA